jgi:ComF family protein
LAGLRTLALRAASVLGVCAICRSSCSQALCAACLQQFAPLLPRCGGCARTLPAPALRCGQCLQHASAYQHCWAGADYAQPWDQLIAGFKFHRKTELASALCELLLRGVRGAAHGALPTLLLPVPLSVQRLRERGYNQAWELARRAAGRLGVSAHAELLLRTRDTPHQTGMSRAQRERNLRDAFCVAPVQRRHLQGAHVALIDDVLTTGATAHAAALALTRAGAARVDVWVVARTPLPG